jgi:hypothetical protein
MYSAYSDFWVNDSSVVLSGQARPESHPESFFFLHFRHPAQGWHCLLSSFTFPVFLKNQRRWTGGVGSWWEGKRRTLNVSDVQKPIFSDMETVHVWTAPCSPEACQSVEEGQREYLQLASEPPLLWSLSHLLADWTLCSSSSAEVPSLTLQGR